MELLRRWRVVGRAGEALDPDELSFLGTKEADAAMKNWTFLVENVVADVDKAKATGSDYLRNC